MTRDLDRISGAGRCRAAKTTAATVVGCAGWARARRGCGHGARTVDRAVRRRIRLSHQLIARGERRAPRSVPTNSAATSLSRVIVGSRTAFLAPLVLALSVVTLSVTMGIAAGLKGGWLDASISRVVELLYSVPALMVAIIIVGVTGGGFAMAVIVLIIFGVPSTFRLMRSAVMERLGLPYIEAARTLGVGTGRIVFTQLIPAMFPLIVHRLLPPAHLRNRGNIRDVVPRSRRAARITRLGADDVREPSVHRVQRLGDRSTGNFHRGPGRVRERRR